VTFDVAVVGGGLVGAATAYELAQGGASTVVYDRHDAGRATDAGAGILSPATAQRDDTGWNVLCVAAGQHYDALIPQLGDDAGWARCGILELATRPSDLPAFEWLAERAGGGREVSADAARDLCPVLGPIERALHHPDAARVDGRSMARALRNAAVAHGVEWREEDAPPIDGIDAGAIVIAGGAWTPAISAQVGVTLPVVPLRGQIMHLDVPEYDTATWPIVQPVFGHYMVPWDDRHVAIGATVEHAGFATDVTAGGVHEILREALRVMPGLESARVREVRVGLRPASSDDIPIIGPLTDNVFVCTGHGANGLLLGPISGRIIADVVLQREPRMDLTRFSPARFD
jgi:D-amino-acid dehydrogenase